MSPHCLIMVAAMMPLPQESRPTAIKDAVAGMREEIDAKQLRGTIRDLVGFGTRHVASATDSKERGTGAARSYLEGRMKSFIAQSGGRLGVARESFKVMNRRVGGEVEVVNIVATLKGTTDPDRVYVVGGHYDSRNSNARDGRNDAPGANDDKPALQQIVENSFLDNL